MRFSRRLKDVHQGLTLPAGQEKIIEFLTNTKNVQRINGLVEDIHEVLMDYQVCMSICIFSPMPNIYTRPHCNKISVRRVVGSLQVPSLYLSLLCANLWIGTSRCCCSQRNAPHSRCQLPLWKQAEVSKGNKEGCPQGD